MRRSYQKHEPSSGARLLRGLLHDDGIEPIWLEYGVAGFEVDLYLPNHHVGIEYDGPLHDDKGKWLKDAARQRELETSGLPVLRIHHSEVDACKTGDSRQRSEARKALHRKVRGFIATVRDSRSNNGKES